MKEDKRTHIDKSNDKPSEQLVRLYVQVSKDLELKMLKLIYDVKCDPTKKKLLTKKGRVTKRTIVEEALEEYFERRSM
jgi:hypothetical protein